MPRPSILAAFLVSLGPIADRVSSLRSFPLAIPCTWPIGRPHPRRWRSPSRGTYWRPAGGPAEGAVVVTSAGGQAVTNADGSFRLEVRVTPEAMTLQITAVGRGNGDLLATKEIVLHAASGPVSVGSLALSRAGSCSASWLPTFGEQPGTDYFVYALAVFDDGGGDALYAAGLFSAAGAVEAGTHRKMGRLELDARRQRRQQRGPCPGGLRRRQRSCALRRWVLLDRWRRGREPDRQVGRLELDGAR